MYHCNIPPDQDSYTVIDGKSVVSTKLGGGLSRVRTDIVNAASVVSINWTVDQRGFEYLRAFYNTGTNKGGLPFTIDLYMDRVALTRHKAYFVPESFQLSSQKGLQFVVSAQIEAQPLPVDGGYEGSLLIFYGSDIDTTEEAEGLLDGLATFVNVELDEALD